MKNTIALSTDQQNLLLIDENVYSEFPLDKAGGVVLGLTQGQVVATPASEQADLPTVLDSFSLDTRLLQWTCILEPQSATLYFIGISRLKQNELSELQPLLAPKRDTRGVEAELEGTKRSSGVEAELEGTRDLKAIALSDTHDSSLQPTVHSINLRTHSARITRSADRIQLEVLQ